MDAHGHGARNGLLRVGTRMGESEDSDDSFNLPSPQLVERSGASSPEAFFYEIESASETLPPPSYPKVRSWTRGLDTTSLKRYLNPVQGKKPPPSDPKHRESALKTANLIRQRAYSPLLTLEKPAYMGMKQRKADGDILKMDVRLLPYQKLLVRAGVSKRGKGSGADSGREVRRSAGKEGLNAAKILITTSPSSQLKALPLRALPLKPKPLKPLRSLTPQLVRTTKPK